VSLIVWILGLSRVPVSIAYPLLSLGYVINAIGAYYLLGEALTTAAGPDRLHHSRRVAVAAANRSMSYLKFASPILDETTIAASRRCCVRSAHQWTVGAAFRAGFVGILRRQAGALLTSATAAIEVALQLCDADTATR
jgi:hypothetical protein